jgi:inorganic pyrophosphatase
MNKALASITSLMFFGDACFSNPINDVPFKAPDGLYNFYIEIPGGTKEKWEVDKKTGVLKKDQKNGKDRVLNFLPYPGNYGFIPQTLSGDGDPIDLIDLDESLGRGTIKRISVIGAMYFEDNNEIDYKFVGVSREGTFKHLDSIEDLFFEKPSVLEIIKLWFLSYKKQGKMVFFKFLDRGEASRLIEAANQRWKANRQNDWPNLTLRHLSRRH